MKKICLFLEYFKKEILSKTVMASARLGFFLNKENSSIHKGMRGSLLYIYIRTMHFPGALRSYNINSLIKWSNIA